MLATLKGVFAIALAAGLPALVDAACGKVIVDNDWSGSSSYTSALELLGANCTILGITSTIGNLYAYQGAAHILRFLEIANIDYTARDLPQTKLNLSSG